MSRGSFKNGVIILKTKSPHLHCYIKILHRGKLRKTGSRTSCLMPTSEPLLHPSPAFFPPSEAWTVRSLSPSPPVFRNRLGAKHLGEASTPCQPARRQRGLRPRRALRGGRGDRPLLFWLRSSVSGPRSSPACWVPWAANLTFFGLSFSLITMGTRRATP